MQRVTLKGFIILDYYARFPEALEALGAMVAAGTLRSEETVVEGFDQLPAALNMLFAGENTGKLVVHIEE